MKFGLDVANLGKNSANTDNLIVLAKEADKSGWDGFFLWSAFLNDDSYLISNPIVTLSAITSQTTKIKLGFLVLPLPFFKPWLIASEIATLDHLSKGRIILGVGSGFNSRDFSSFNEESDLKIRAEKLDVSLDIFTCLWSGMPFSYSGKYYQLTNVQFLPTCYQIPRVPLWIAGFWPHKKPFIRAAKYDGVYPGSDDNPISPTEITEIMTYINGFRTGFDPFDVVIWIKLPDDDLKIKPMVQSYENSGVTWLNIVITPFSHSWNDLLEIVKSGPPKV